MHLCGKGGFGSVHLIPGTLRGLSVFNRAFPDGVWAGSWPHCLHATSITLLQMLQLFIYPL